MTTTATTTTTKDDMMTTATTMTTSTKTNEPSTRIREFAIRDFGDGICEETKEQTNGIRLNERTSGQTNGFDDYRPDEPRPGTAPPPHIAPTPLDFPETTPPLLRRFECSSSSIASKKNQNSMDFVSMRTSLGNITRTGALSERGVLTSNFKPTRKSSMEKLTRHLDKGKIITKKDLSYSKVNPDVTYKVLILGDASVGKTSMLNALTYIQSGKEQGFSSWTEGFGTQSLLPTIGIDFRNIVFSIDGARVQLQIWDTAGQERFRSINRFHYRDAMGILLVYDISQKETFNNIQSWLDGIDLTEASQTAEDIVIVGNKGDLETKRQVSREDRKRLKDKCYCPVYEVSAKSGNNVEYVFTQLALKIVERCHPKLMTSYLSPSELRDEENMISFEERTTRWTSPHDVISTPLTRMQRFYPEQVRAVGPPPSRDASSSKKRLAPKIPKKRTPPPPAPPAPKTPSHVRQEFEWRSPDAVFTPNKNRRDTIKLSPNIFKGKTKCCAVK